MKSLLLVSAVTLAGVSWAWNAAPFGAQDGNQGLMRVGNGPGEPSQVVGSVDSGATQAVSPSIDWEARLRDPDLDAREKALDELLQQARQDPGLRNLLEGWSQGQDDLAWTARLGLRLLPQERVGSRGWGLRPGDPFEALRSMPPMDWGPWGDPFGEDPFEWLHAGKGPFGNGPFGKLDLNLQDLQDVQGQSQSFSVKAGPDGVRVEVHTQDADGEDVKVYEADSLEALLDAHPELQDAVGSSGRSFSLRSPFRPADPIPSDRRVLGVYLRADLQAGGELVVQRVQPGSLAERLGVQAGDVLLHLDGGEIHSRDDIARKLMERADEDPIRLGVRRDGEGQILTWDPEGLSAGARPLERVTEPEASDE